MSNRNSNARFELAPQVGIERSSFKMPFNVKTSFNVGELVPFCEPIEVLPGDTWDIDTSFVARLQTLITPVMDDMYLDVYWFFVPNRLVWNHWQNFCGENTASEWYPTTEYEVPQIVPPQNGWNVGTIADYFGVPPYIEASTEDDGINVLPFRAYSLIVNDWFRDENLQDPLVIPLNDTTVTGSNGSNYIVDCAKGGKPFIACKYHDYLTSCLPAPQKSPDINFLDGMMPVTPTTRNISQPGIGVRTKMRSSGTDAASINLGTDSAGITSAYSGSLGTNTGNVYFSNLWADLSDLIDSDGNSLEYQLSINSLRRAFQIQRLFEKDARSGTRYIEILKGHFGVTSPDARLQRPEYLGGSRVPINIEQVLQTSSTDNTTPQGNLAGWSQTNNYSSDVHKSFVEHGYIIGLMCARYDHSYQEALNRLWQRRSRFEFYWPALAHLGEQPVYKSEIVWDGRTGLDAESNSAYVFGYQEAWAEYRYRPNIITGEMRSQYASSLDFWHFGDYYQTQPTLSSSWIMEDKSNVDRCLAVTSAKANQIFIDIMCNATATRPMPLYSIPGLIDHF